MTIIDISPLINEKTPVWPGDTKLTRRWLGQISEGSNIDLSTVTMTTHIGAHADAPSHYTGTGLAIDEVQLEPYLGPCTVVDVCGIAMIEPQHCVAAVDSGAQRILFKSRTVKQATEAFETEFTAFTPDAMEYMGKNGVMLVGIDTSSMDPFTSKNLPAHAMLHRYNIRNLEGLELAHVTPGNYELIALPLKLGGFDASPVRAVLRTI